MLAFLFRIIVAGFVGFIVGLSNKSANKSPSGLVFSMICMSSALIAVVSIEFVNMLSIPWASDPGRISAQVVSALGFLGTGLIWISSNNHVKGLPIAAGLWVTAILGILIGMGEYTFSFISLIFLVIIYALSEMVENGKIFTRNKND